MGIQINTQPQTFKSNSTVVGLNAGLSAVAGLTVYGSVSASGLLLGSVPLSGLQTTGATAQQVLTYNGSTGYWVASAAGGGSGIAPVVTTASGTGSQTAFTISGYTTNSPNSYLITVGGLTQRPTTDYTVSTNTINFTTAPPNGSQVLIMAYQSSPAAANNTTVQAQSNGGATSSISTLNFNNGLSARVTSGTAEVRLPEATAGQVLTYNGSTSTWVASAAKGTGTLTYPNYGALSALSVNNIYQNAVNGYLNVRFNGSFMNGAELFISSTTTANFVSIGNWGDDINNNTKMAAAGLYPIPANCYFTLTSPSTALTTAGMGTFENTYFSFIPAL